MDVWLAVAAGFSAVFGAGGCAALWYSGRELRQYAARLTALEQAFPSWSNSMQIMATEANAKLEAVEGRCNGILQRAEDEVDQAKTIRNRANNRLRDAGLTSTGEPVNPNNGSQHRQIGVRRFGS